MSTLDKEVRQILLGRTKLLPDGRLSTLVEGDFMMPRGIGGGAGLQKRRTRAEKAGETLEKTGKAGRESP